MEGATDDFTVVLLHEGPYEMGSAGPFAALTQRHSRTKDDLIAKLGDTNKLKKLLFCEVWVQIICPLLKTGFVLLLNSLYTYILFSPLYIQDTNPLTNMCVANIFS